MAAAPAVDIDRVETSSEVRGKSVHTYLAIDS